MRYVEDPSVAGAARVEHATMMREILDRYEAGEGYFVAREAVLATHGPRIAKEHGKEAAKRAIAAVCSHAVTDLPRASQLAHAAAAHDAWLAHLDRWYGPGHRWTRRQALTIRLLGAPHWAAHPVAAMLWLPATAALAGLSWWFGPTSLPGAVSGLAGLAILADVVFERGRPAGRDLKGAELDAWRAAMAEKEAAEADAAAEIVLEEKAQEENEQAKWRAAQRSIRSLARQMEKDADAVATSILPPAPPLDDAGKAILAPRATR